MNDRPPLSPYPPRSFFVTSALGSKMRSNHGSCGKKVATLNAVLMLPASKMPPPEEGDAAAASNSNDDDDDDDDDEKRSAESTMLSNAIIDHATAATSSSEGASARRAGGVRECHSARGANADADGADDAHSARHVIEAGGRHIL